MKRLKNLFELIESLFISKLINREEMIGMISDLSKYRLLLLAQQKIFHCKIFLTTITHRF